MAPKALLGRQALTGLWVRRVQWALLGPLALLGRQALTGLWVRRVQWALLGPRALLVPKARKAPLARPVRRV